MSSNSTFFSFNIYVNKYYFYDLVEILISLQCINFINFEKFQYIFFF